MNTKQGWVVRTGHWHDDKADWNPSAVKFMRGNIMRLTVGTGGDTKPYSAGVMGLPMLPNKRYVFDIQGRLDALDPNACFAIWSSQNPLVQELDYLEATRWGDSNAVSLYHSTEWRSDQNGNPLVKWTESQRARAGSNYSLVIQTHENSLDYSMIMDWAADPDGKEVIKGSVPDVVFKNTDFRVALWLPRLGFLINKPSALRGVTTVDVKLDIFDTQKEGTKQ